MASYVFPYCTTGTSGNSGDNYPDEGLIVEPSFKTQIVEASSGAEQRLALWSDPRHKFQYKWTKQSNDKSILTTIYDFFVARKGRYQSFGLFEFDAHFQWTTVAIGTATGSLGETVNSAGRNVTSRSVYLNGVLKTNYTVGTGTGTNGRDLITNTTPAWTAGQTITETFTGQRWFVVRFDEDSMPMGLFSAKLYETGLKMIQAVGET